jgi:hypothetical protein
LVEVTVLATQEQIDHLAARIERAYSLRRTFWHRGCSAPQVWTTAAVTLLQLNQGDPLLPVDPELYVASQPIEPTFSDPWAELTQPSACYRYRDRVRKIIRGLREELRGEVRWAERRIQRGAAIEEVLTSGRCALSPLGCFITAQRAGRHDLVERFRTAAAAQHQSCPLYRQACLRLLPAETYPVLESPTDVESASTIRHVETFAQLN